MEYNPPYGSTDPDAPYVDRSTPNGIQGSKVPARAIEHTQREIVTVIERAGLIPDGNDTAQLWAALQELLKGFPIYPNCLSSNGTFDLTSPSPGTIRVPAGVDYVMRGGTPYTTTQTDMTTVANKTYHVRWSSETGFRILDLASLTYNPTSAVEANAAFDSTYDSMLVARVVTNGSNVATITNLINRPKLIHQVNRRDTLNSTLNWATLAGSDVSLNWARTPEVAFMGMNEFRSNGSGPDGIATPGGAGKILNIGARIPAAGANRYGIPALEVYYEDDAGNNGLGAFNFVALSI